MSTSPTVGYWWNAPEYEAHDHLMATVREVENRQFEIHQSNLRYAKMYSNRELMTLDWATLTVREVLHRPSSTNTENLVKSAVDTFTSFIGKNRPKASIVTHDGSYEQRQQAELLDRFLYAEMVWHDAWAKLTTMFRDACVFGTGFLRVDIDPMTKELFIERIMPDELIIDQRECISCPDPQQMHLRRVVNREAVRAMYPDAEGLEEALLLVNNKWVNYRSPGQDYVVVVESWHVGENGRHVIAIDGCTLLDEKYTRDRFPFVKFVFSEPLTGYYGAGVVEQGMPYQNRMNRLNWVIEKGQELYAIPRTFINGAANTLKTQFDNELGHLYYWRGTEKPETVIWPAVSQELYAERVHTREQFFADLGLSQLSSQAKLPSNARLDSAPALREYNAVEDERNASVAQRYEKACLELNEHMIELGPKVYGKKKKVVWRNGKVAEEINWSDIDIKRDRYSLIIEASSIINMTPAARKDQVNEWAAKGYITPDEARSMEDHPDLEASLSLTTAAVRNIDWTIAQLRKGEVVTPDPFQHLEFGTARVQMAYLDDMRLGAPEEILANERRWIEMAQHILNPPQDTAIPAPGAPGVANPSPPPGVVGPDGMPMDPSMMGPDMGGAMPSDMGIPLGESGTPVPALATTAQGSPVVGLM